MDLRVEHPIDLTSFTRQHGEARYRGVENMKAKSEEDESGQGLPSAPHPQSQCQHLTVLSRN